MSTSAEDVSIHAVSPLSIFEAGAATDGAALASAFGASCAGGGGACAQATVVVAPSTSSVASANRNRVTFCPSSDRALVALARADPDGRVHRMHEDLAVADVARLGRARDHLGDLVDEVIRDDDLDLDLREEVDRVLAAAVELGVSLLSAEAAHLRHRHADDADAREGLLDVVELERLDDRLDLLHAKSSPRP